MDNKILKDSYGKSFFNFVSLPIKRFVVANGLFPHLPPKNVVMLDKNTIQHFRNRLAEAKTMPIVHELFRQQLAIHILSHSRLANRQLESCEGVGKKRRNFFIYSITKGSRSCKSSYGFFTINRLLLKS